VLSDALYLLRLLPVLYGRFGCGLATTSIVRCDADTGYKLHRCETENGKMTIGRSINNGTLYIFKMTDKTGSSNRSSSREHCHSHRLIQPNKSEVLVLL